MEGGRGGREGREGREGGTDPERVVVRGRMEAAREGSERKEGGRERRGEREEIEVGRTARGSRGVCVGGIKAANSMFSFLISGTCM